MNAWQVWAQPWWVNLLFLVPILVFLGFRRKGLQLTRSQLLVAAIFASSFGFVEAAVVVYLRAAVGLLPGYQGTLGDVQRAITTYDQSKSIADFPPSLLAVEVWREAATMVILASVAFLAATKFRERWAIFLWTFAIWDATYYGGLWATIRWPGSLKELDVLFLIPVPWISQVWFPLVVSGLTLVAILLSRGRPIAD
jgi:hypothetical protein